MAVPFLETLYTEMEVVACGGMGMVLKDAHERSLLCACVMWPELVHHALVRKCPALAVRL